MNTRLCMDALKAWLARSSRKNEPTETIEQPVEPTESTSTLAASPTTSRKRKSTGELRSRSKRPRLEWSLAVRDMAEERDIVCCAITKMGEPVQVCHIYPFALGNEAEKLWIILECFWAPETFDRWKKDIMGPDGTEVAQNLLCLSTIVHDLWGSARLAFEPVEMSEEKTSLTMRFWWLPRRAYSKEMDMCVATSLPSDPCNAKLWNCDTDQPIYSGQLVTMTTRDPEAMPFPSFDLLQMQWFLNLIAAMSGVVDVTDEELEEVSEGFSDDGDTVRETSEESSEEEEEDDDDDVLAYPDD
ncbi:hypothetical protein AFLA70_281g001350 [Aspergillus flavus AF70]|nr:hypothetical protein AFLA70_281g001350 [Aspergillus flavus AF70]